MKTVLLIAAAFVNGMALTLFHAGNPAWKIAAAIAGALYACTAVLHSTDREIEKLENNHAEHLPVIRDWRAEREAEEAAHEAERKRHKYPDVQSFVDRVNARNSLGARYVFSVQGDTMKVFPDTSAENEIATWYPTITEESSARNPIATAVNKLNALGIKYYLEYNAETGTVHFTSTDNYHLVEVLPDGKIELEPLKA